MSLPQQWVTLAPKKRRNGEVDMLQYPSVHLKDPPKFRRETDIILEPVGVRSLQSLVLKKLVSLELVCRTEVVS